MIKALKVVNNGAFRLQLKQCIFPLREKGDQLRTKAGEAIEGQGIGELTGSNTKKPIWLPVQGFTQLFEKLIDIDVKSHPGDIEIGLENTINTIDGTVDATVDHMVTAAAILAGCWTRLKKLPAITAKEKLALTAGEVADKVVIELVGFLSISDHRPGTSNPSKDVLAQFLIKATLLDIDMVDMAGRVPPTACFFHLGSLPVFHIPGHFPLAEVLLQDGFGNHRALQSFFAVLAVFDRVTNDIGLLVVILKKIKFD